MESLLSRSLKLKSKCSFTLCSEKLAEILVCGNCNISLFLLFWEKPIIVLCITLQQAFLFRKCAELELLTIH